MKTLNELYSSLSVRRRYEVWFTRMGLADGSGAWWFRYLLLNPGRSGCPGNPRALPVQTWATWFPKESKPQSFIQGFPLEGLELTARDASPFRFLINSNEIGENFCRGDMEVEGHRISWDLHYRSNFRCTLSSKGWIGFSRTPHSDALFSGKIVLDGRKFTGDPLGYGVQGHNCGYRYRGFWKWAHAYFVRSGRAPSTLEALVYDMPLGLVFRKAVLRHDGESYEFRNFKEVDAEAFHWNFRGIAKNGLCLDAMFDGTGPGMHRLPYWKTDCSGSFDVLNNSLARATSRLEWPDGRVEKLETTDGAALELGGQRRH